MRRFDTGFCLRAGAVDRFGAAVLPLTLAVGFFEAAARPNADATDGAVGAAVADDNAWSSDAPFGEPQPVHASHPGPALKSPLFPEVISRNVPFWVAMF